ncbi:MAG TPA: hypothetical protein VMR95_00415 [Candidatus Binatia bacterium]|nr:hypothetical protein [Candidatus Binatia bacterium]
MNEQSQIQQVENTQLGIIEKFGRISGAAAFAAGISLASMVMDGITNADAVGRQTPEVSALDNVYCSHSASENVCVYGEQIGLVFVYTNGNPGENFQSVVFKDSTTGKSYNRYVEWTGSNGTINIPLPGGEYIGQAEYAKTIAFGQPPSEEPFNVIAGGQGIKPLPKGSCPVGETSPPASGTPIDITPLEAGKCFGYYVTMDQGGIDTFGVAKRFGSLKGEKLASLVIGMTLTPNDKGYYLADKDGDVYAFGDAKFYGSATGKLTDLTGPVIGITSAPQGGDYILGTLGGTIIPFHAKFQGDLSADVNLKYEPPSAIDITSVASSPTGQGYYLLLHGGNIYPFNAAPFGEVPEL